MAMVASTGATFGAGMAETAKVWPHCHTGPKILDPVNYVASPLLKPGFKARVATTAA